MRFLLIVLFITAVVEFYGSVKLTGNDGWMAQVEINEKLFKNSPAVFLIYNSRVTNTEFLLQNDYNRLIKLNLEDGRYEYVIYDIDKKILEKGNLDLTAPFQAGIKKNAPDYAEVEIKTKDNRTIEAGLKLDGKSVDHKEVQVSGSNSVTFQNLKPGFDYRIELSVKNYSVNLDFRTLPKNAALNKPVYGTFTKLPESRFVDDTTPVIRRINDGKLEWLKGMAASGEVNAGDQYAFINLLGLLRLKEVMVYWHAYYYPLKYSLYFSEDGTNWKYIHRETNNLVEKTAGDNTPMMLDDIKTNISAYYLGVIIKKGEKIKTRLALRNYLELLEIEAYE